MKKLILLGLALFSIVNSGCKKSSHCVVKDSSGTVIKDYGTKTGTSTDVNNYQNSCKADAPQYNGTLSCS